MSNIFNGVGTGFSVGVSIVVAGYYGSGNFEKVKKVVNSSLALAFLLGLGLTAILIVFADTILAILNTPQDLIDAGMGFYRIEMMTMAFYFFNYVYIAVEKARGNSKMILVVNMVLATSKIALAALFVIVLDQGVAMIAVSTLVSNMMVTALGIYRLRDKMDVFGLSKEYVSLKYKSLSETIKISIPVIVEKCTFSMGKTVVNSIGVYYGTNVVGALGVSNSTSALANVLNSANSDGSVTIIRQNVGAGYRQRAYQCFKAVLVINIGFGVFAFLITYFGMDYFLPYFASGDAEFEQLIKDILTIEMLSNVFSALSASALSFLYAMGRTKLSLLVNFSKLFVFRIPLLLVLRYFTSLPGGTVMGILMMFSNTCTGIMGIVVAYIVIKNEHLNIKEKE